MKLLLVFAAGLAVLAGSVQSETPGATATSTSATQPKPVDPDPVVCRAITPPTGSLIGPHRRCLRRSEWEKMSRDAHDLVNDLNHGEQQVNCTPTLAGHGC